MVKAYREGMPREYQYQSAGKHEVKISGNLKSIAFSGSPEMNNGLASMLVRVKKLDSNVEGLMEYAFSGCELLEEVDLGGTNVKDISAYAFNNCTNLGKIIYGSSLARLSSFSAEGCTSLSVLAPESYEKDLDKECQTSVPVLESLYQLASGQTPTKIECLVVPEKVGSASTNYLEGSPSIKHVVFMRMAQDDQQFEDEVIATQMFGLNQDCTFEDGYSNKVYNFTAGSSPSVSDSDSTTYFNLEINDLPDKMADLADGSAYEYNQTYVQWCMQNSRKFAVLYIDSKTSAMSKMLLMEKDVMELLPKNAVTFVLDRYRSTSNAVHYRGKLMDDISRQLKLVHTTTDTSTIHYFPEMSFVSNNGMKFQKLHLDVQSFSTMKTQIDGAAGNVFN